MAITKTTTTSIKDASVEEANINNCAATNTKLGADAVTSAKINNGTVTADDLASTLDLSSKTVTLPSSAISFDREYNNIGLLGFKMAVNESLTVFNLVDGVVDEFNDESGTDEAEGSNDTYCGTDDFYTNTALTPASFSAGFSINSITEPDTSTAQTNPAQGQGVAGDFTVPTCMTSLTFKLWGAGGGAPTAPQISGGGGGFSTGTLAVTPGQVIEVTVAEGGETANFPNPSPNCIAMIGGFGGSSPGPLPGLGGGPSGPTGSGYKTAGGGASFLVTGTLASFPFPAPSVFAVAGGGGGGVGPAGSSTSGGAGGGLTGCAGGSTSEQTSATPQAGGGGSQSTGGQGSSGKSATGQSGSIFRGGAAGGGTGCNMGGGGGGYYGGGGSDGDSGGGGGSSYYGHPQITGGSTEEGTNAEGGGVADPAYVAGTNESTSIAAPGVPPGPAAAEDGYVLITGCGSALSTASTTIVSEPFTSTSVATSARIVVFEENVDTPTLNTDVIASISRDGTNFTNATLSDSGYVTGSSGQRILTGQADVSGQPSGQSMRWKLQLANNQVKIHGVSLSWA